MLFGSVRFIRCFWCSHWFLLVLLRWKEGLPTHWDRQRFPGRCFLWWGFPLPSVSPSLPMAAFFSPSAQKTLIKIDHILDHKINLNTFFFN